MGKHSNPFQLDYKNSAKPKSVKPHVKDFREQEEKLLENLRKQCRIESTIIWVLMGLLLYIANGRLFSLEALVFFTIGIFVVRLIVATIERASRFFVIGSTIGPEVPFILSHFVIALEAIACIKSAEYLYKAVEYLFEGQFFG